MSNPSPLSRVFFLAPALFLAGAAAAEPVEPGLILATLRESLSSKGPAAERVRVTIKQPGKPARSDEFLVKVDPGRKPDHSDAAVWMELGELRVYASAGRLVAVHTGDETACYTANYGDRLTADTLRALLPPIPAPLVNLILGESGDAPNVSLSLTPYTPRITWTAAEAAGAQIVTLTGARDPFPGERVDPGDTTVSMVIDARTSRPTRFAATLPDAADLRLEITPTVPGNPATWPIRFEGRTSVVSLSDLRERRGDAAAAGVVPELTLMDATWSNWTYQSVFRRPAGVDVAVPTHLALIFIRESTKDAFGAPSADAKAAEEELRRLEAELTGDPKSTVRLVHVVAPVMLTMDEHSRRKVENAVKLRDSAAPDGAARGNIIWASSPERNIERFAPGAAAVAVIIRADNSLAGIILLDGRSKEGKSLRDDLRRTLGLEATPAPKPKD